MLVGATNRGWNGDLTEQEMIVDNGLGRKGRHRPALHRDFRNQAIFLQADKEFLRTTPGFFASWSDVENGR